MKINLDNIIYNADDEEPTCILCDNFYGNFNCSKYCGANHAWNGYERTVYTDDGK